MSTLASLPMYDLPEVRPHTDALWAGIAHALAAELPAAASISGSIPTTLDRTLTREEHWRHAGLVFSQTCGYPLRMYFSGDLRVLGAPRYRADGCSGHDYSSVLITHQDGPDALGAMRGKVLAVNGRDSQSGYNAVKAALVEAGLESDESAPFFCEMRVSGTHRNSVQLVRERGADFAAIDAVSFALIKNHAPEEVLGLKVIGYSPAAPSLPWVTSSRADEARVNALRQAIATVMTAPELASARDALCLDGFDALDMDEYERIDVMTARSRALKLAPEDHD